MPVTVKRMAISVRNRTAWLRWLLTLICLGSSCLPAGSGLAAASVLYVALTGSNSAGDGSIGKPFRNLWQAGSVATPGTIVYVRGGTYPASNEFIHATGGTSSAPVTFMPYPGERVVFDGTGGLPSGATGGNIVTINQSSHVIFDSFELQNSQWGALQVADSNDITVRNCLIHDSMNYGLLLSGQQLHAENNQIWNVVMRNAGNSTGACGCWGSALNSAQQSNGSPSRDISLRDNLVYNAWGEGIGIYDTDDASVEGNVVHDVYSVHIYLSQARNVLVNRNYLYALDSTHNRSGYPATGIGMATEPNPANWQLPTSMLQNITLSNNIMAGIGLGISYWYDSRNAVPENTYQNIHIYHNVIKSPLNAALLFQPVRNNSLPPSGVILRNNIVEQGATGNTLLVGDPAAWTYSNNDWPDGVPAGAAEPGSFAANPMFVQPQPGGLADGFRLQAGSPAIAKAAPLSEVTTDYAGTARDPTHPTIGAFEYVQNTIPQSGWWWNPAESGRGYSVEVSGNTLFMSAYLYDTSGRATWYITAGPLNADGSYSGQLQEYTGGQTLTGGYKAPSVKGNISPISLACTSAVACMLGWAGGTVPIQRYVWDSHAAPADAPETGWWWNAGESGRGYFIEQQGDVLFLSGYMYDSAGNDVWYIGAGPKNGNTFLNSWSQYAFGQTLTGTYKSPTVVDANVGSLILQFSGNASGQLTLPNGRAIPVTRYRF